MGNCGKGDLCKDWNRALVPLMKRPCVLLAVLDVGSCREEDSGRLQAPALCLLWGVLCQATSAGSHLICKTAFECSDGSHSA